MPAWNEKKQRVRSRFRSADIAAVCIIFAVFGYILCRQKYGVGIVDEQFFYTLPQRLLRGDRLIADEWHVTQLNALLEWVPYRLHLLVFGSTEGLLLHTRYFATVTQLVLSLYLWSRLRRYGLGALGFILPVCTYGPLFTFTVYNVAVTGIAVVAVELFAVPKSPSRPKLVFLGIVTAYAVLAEPLLAIGYFAWTAQVFVCAVLRKTGRVKERAHVVFPTLRTWGWMTLGILLPASAVLYYFMTAFGWDVGLLIRCVPDIFTDYDHNYQLFTENSHFSRVFTLLSSTPFFFGFESVLPGAALTVYAAVRRRRGFGRRQKRIVFLLATLLFFVSYVHLFWFCFISKQGGYIIYFPWMSGVALPFVVYTAVLLLIADRAQPRLVAFLLMSLALSVGIDIASDACMGAGAVLCILPAVVMAGKEVRACFADWRASLPADPSPEGRRWLRLPAGRSLRICALLVVSAGAVVFSFFWFFENVYFQTRRQFVERSGSNAALWEPMDCTVERGPFKGIRTTAHVFELHNDTLADMDAITAQSGGPLFTDALYPVTYLYSGLPVGTYSCWYVEEDDPDRVLHYWRLHPERIPEYVYVPYFNTVSYQEADPEQIREKLDRLGRIFDCEITEGQAGYILHVLGVRTLTLPETAAD